MGGGGGGGGGGGEEEEEREQIFAGISSRDISQRTLCDDDSLKKRKKVRDLCVFSDQSKNLHSFICF